MATMENDDLAPHWADDCPLWLILVGLWLAWIRRETH